MPKSILLTGLSSSGKSTIAKAVADKIDVIWLDGDIMRQYISFNSGFSVRDRFEHLMRMAGIAKVLNDQGKDVIMSFIAPSANMRQMMKFIVGVENFEVAYCDCSYSICEARDFKGNYKKAAEGILDNFTGSTQYYEIPANPEYTFDTSIPDPTEYINTLIKAFGED